MSQPVTISTADITAVLAAHRRMADVRRPSSRPEVEYLRAECRCGWPGPRRSLEVLTRHRVKDVLAQIDADHEGHLLDELQRRAVPAQPVAA